MVMKMTTPIAEIDVYQAIALKAIERAEVEVFCDLGDMCDTEARDRTGEDSWYDDTGRLRSSIGYTVAENGLVVKTSPFEIVEQGSQGAAEGRALARKLAWTYNESCSLVMVAGAPYAEEMEAMENKVVLSSAELLAKREAPKMMKRLEKLEIK